MSHTMFATALLGFLLVLLSLNASMTRMSKKITIGDGDDLEMKYAMRAQANLAEYAPIGLFLIWIMEYKFASTVMLTGVTVSFVVARYMHAIGMVFFEKPNLFRFIGTIVTWLAILAGSFQTLKFAYYFVKSDLVL